MNTSDQVDKIFSAIISAQSKMGNAKKTCNNPFFKSKYADLAEIIEVTKEILNENGLAVVQSPGGNGTAVTVTARIIHTSGQWLEDTITLTATKNDPQQAGSAITYARRYQLAALFNIAQEDDDGNNASGKGDKEPLPKSEIAELKSALIDHINAGHFEYPENVEKVMKDNNVEKMKEALAVAKQKKNAK